MTPEEITLMFDAVFWLLNGLAIFAIGAFIWALVGFWTMRHDYEEHKRRETRKLINEFKDLNKF